MGSRSLTGTEFARLSMARFAEPRDGLRERHGRLAVPGRHRAGVIVQALLALVLAVPAAAQAPAGRIAGRVTGEDARPLVNARVSILALGRAVLTDADGRYILTGVPAGTHTIVVEYVGYETKTLAGVVVSGDLVALDVSLEPQAIEVDAITVIASRDAGSDVALLGDRLRAAAVVDAIGAAQIARSPDGDAAAALRRVPGVTVVDGKYVYVRGLGDRYGATTLNGAPLPSPEPDRKVVPLDLVPASFLESVVAAKTYSPDQPGDHAGGLVEIRTRDFAGARTFEVSASLGFDTEATFADGLGHPGGRFGFLGIGTGARTLPAALPGDVPLQSLARPELERVGEAFSGAWGPTPHRLPPDHGFGLAFGRDFGIGGRRLAVLGTIGQSTHYTHREGQIERALSASGGAEPVVDFVGNASTRSVSLGGLLHLGLELSRGGRLSLDAIVNRTAEDEARVLEGFNLDTNADQRNLRLRYLAQSLVGSQLSGEHRLGGAGGAELRWRAAYSVAERYEPDTREMLYRRVADGRFLWENFIQSGSIFHQDMDETGVAGGVDLRIPVPVAARAMSLSLGAAADLRNRTAHTRRLRFVPVGNVPESVRALPPDRLLTPETIGPDGFELRDATFRTDNFDAAYRVIAAYAMVDAEPVPRLRVQAGARIEGAEQTVTPRDLFDLGLEPVAGARLETTDVLPALNLTLTLAERMNLRAGVSRTLARPQLRELAPFSYADYAGGHLVLGNTLLERSRITNLDLRWEWAPRADAIVSVSAFLKRFDDPIEALVLPSTELKKTWVNASSAANRGVEIEFRSSLAPIGIDALTVNANLTLVRSSVRTGGLVRYFDAGQPQTTTLPERERALQGQSPYVVNLGVSYLHPSLGASATLLYNRFGRRIDAVGSALLPDVFEEARGQLDFVMDQPIGRGVSVKFAANRLLGNVVRFTQGGDVVRRYDAGRTFSLSASWSPDGN